VFNILSKEIRLTGSFTRYAKFTYDAWTHPDTLAAVSRVAGIELVPVMDIEISHVNILEGKRGGNIHNEYAFGWHRDDYPYVCVLMLSDTTHMTGGQTLLREGSERISVRNPPKMVSHG
jgi:hypothetical protein